MPRCVIIGCRNGYKKKIVLASGTDVVEKESKFTLFCKPSDPNFSKVWEDKIPKEEGAVLPNRYVVCHEHFDESQIIKNDVTIINGEEIKLPRTRWKLVVGAFPTIFTGTPVELFLKKAVRKPPTVRLPLGNITNYPDSTLQSHRRPKHVTLRRLRCTWHIADSQVYIPRTSFTYDQCPLRRDLIAVLIPSHWMDFRRTWDGKRI
ncbi:hypothetical protein DAPPUDRAFT_330561 [Daphnia pulex]|uniref:THAP-type domain-containing protein n=1 Tax=Daphnia pulex TaxID=6669 RepID=E9HJY1_DAPPU|nr:hypothetical protein DAPPUDRAFT_330561 [Daphnia pulex]|eukprot:EFX67961.1 hypothetical protein DAPPUDRAFT_330561 [Daphnia pulex]